MPRPLIVAGASGAGKSFLLENISILDSRVTPIKKLTTRTPRPYETESTRLHLDLEFACGIDRVESCDYRYYYGTDWYGVRREDIDRTLQSGKNPVVIVRSSDTILRIKKDYPAALILYLQSALSGEDLLTKLQRQGRSDIDIEERMRRLEDDFHDYVGHLDLFDYVVINYFEKSSLLEQMDRILQHEFITHEIRQHSVFVLMSFNPDLLDTYIAIQNAGKMLPGLKLQVERAGESYGEYRITEDILHKIKTAALLVCDLTEERPNVYYELGFARGMSKKVLSCARKGTKLHFDITDFKTLFYSSLIELQNRMVAEFDFHFNGPGGSR